MKHSNDRLIEMLIIVVLSTIVGILGGGAFIYSLDNKTLKNNSIFQEFTILNSYFLQF